MVLSLRVLLFDPVTDLRREHRSPVVTDLSPSEHPNPVIGLLPVNKNYHKVKTQDLT